MKCIIFILSLHFTVGAIAQSGKRVDTIHSKILNENRFVWIYLPDKLGDSYPVVYVLDAEANFNTTVEILNRLGKAKSSSIYSQTIVIGIGNIWLRDRDYTPTQVNSVKQSGGGANFTLFLEKELIPYIESKYTASSKRVLVGHSFGGLAAINILLKQKKLFNAYAAIDPSMWWDDQQFLNQSKKVFSENKFDGTSLFVAIANTTQKEMDDVTAIKKDTSQKTVLIRPGVMLVDHLNANRKNNLKFNWKYYKDQDHLSVYPVATGDALEFLLKDL